MRLLYFVLGFVVGEVASYMLTDAHSAIRPVSPDTLKSAQTAKDTPNPTCINATTHMRLMIYPDGKAVVVGRFTIYEACKP